MKRPQAVVFDLGKVLVDFDYGIAARNLEKHSRLSAAEFRQLIDQSPLLFRYETGQLTTRQFYQEVREASGFYGDEGTFRACIGGIFAPMEEMIELHARIKRSGVPTYIFSNTNEIAIEHIRREFPFFNGFEGYIFSYEHGAMKPEAKLYEVVEQRTGLRGEDLLYIDDRPENIAAGVARGWQTILHLNAIQTCSLMARRQLL